MVVLAAGASGAWFYTQSRGQHAPLSLGQGRAGPAHGHRLGHGHPSTPSSPSSRLPGSRDRSRSCSRISTPRSSATSSWPGSTPKFQAAVSSQGPGDAAQATVLKPSGHGEKTRADLANTQAAPPWPRRRPPRPRSPCSTATHPATQHGPEKAGFIAQADEDTAQARMTPRRPGRVGQAQEDAQAPRSDPPKAQLKDDRGHAQAAIANVVQQEAGSAGPVDLDHTEIRAPVDGVVVSRIRGRRPDGGREPPGPTLFTIAQDLTQMQGHQRGRGRRRRIREGLHATFTVDSFANQTSPARSSSPARAPGAQNVVTYNVVIWRETRTSGSCPA